MNNSKDQNHLANLTLQIVFILLLVGLSALHLFRLFQGLETPEGMEQAQIAREVSRGNGLTTKVIRPAAIFQTTKISSENTPSIAKTAQNTYHSPLYPILLGGVFKVIDAGNFGVWKMPDNQTVYSLDRVVAAFSVICFLLSIGVTYFLICRIFDPRIAITTAMLMVLSDILWKFSLSGLPQMLMLLLTSIALTFAYRAVEAQNEGHTALPHVLLAGIFFALLVLTHWMGFWLALGFAIYAGIFLHPRGLGGIAVILLTLIAALFPILQNFAATGQPGGVALLSIYGGIINNEDFIMRSYNIAEANINMKGVTLNILRNSLFQIKGLYEHLAGFVVAPIFFIALLHPFRRQTIADFRWCILIMWIFAAIGMAIFGLQKGYFDSNQLHLLFAPIMAAYGLAYLSILWAKHSLNMQIPLLRPAHLVLAVIISASPLLFSLPKKFVRAIGNEKSLVHYPPYYPEGIQAVITAETEPDDVIVSDMPWAVAWYADRRSIWLPNKKDDLTHFESISLDEGSAIAGVLFSPISSGMTPLISNYKAYVEYFPTIMDQWIYRYTGGRISNGASSSISGINPFTDKYPYIRPIQPLIVYYSSKRLSTER